jgi:hypothetical protein
MSIIIILGARQANAQPSNGDWIAMADPGTPTLNYISNVPTPVNSTSATIEKNAVYSNDGCYYVTRGNNEKGPNFIVHSRKLFSLQPLSITSIPNEEQEHLHINAAVDRSYYQEVINIFKPELFNQLNILYQEELYNLVKFHAGFFMYDEYIDDWKYKTLIKTQSWKLTIHYNRKGEITKIRKTGRKGSSNGANTENIDPNSLESEIDGITQ